MAEQQNKNTITTATNPPPEAATLLAVVEQKTETKEISDIPPPVDTEKGTTRAVKAPNCKKVGLAIALFTFIFSLPVLFCAIWLFFIKEYECEGLLKNLPKLQIGVAIGCLIVFFLSNFVIYARVKLPVPGLVVIIGVMIVILAMGLGMLGDFKTESRRIVASPRWLGLKVHNINNWNNIKSCIYQTGTCKDLISSYAYDANGLFTSGLSHVESGCCMPPSICEMEFVNATYWLRGNKEIDSTIPYNRDCDLWQNDETMLCYDCNACKDGYVKTLERKWLKLGKFLTVTSLLLIICHLSLFVATMWEQYAD